MDDGRSRPMAGSTGHLAILVVGLCLFLQAVALSAQEISLPGGDEPDSGRWWPKPALILGGITLSVALDDEVRDWVLDHRNETYRRYADVVRPFGEETLYVPVALGILSAGLVLGNDPVRDAGTRAVVSLATSAVIEGVLKYSFGRSRPRAGVGNLHFDPFSASSFPSGHTTVAFALATSLADDIQRTWATVVLYSLATASASARLIDDAHWLSDLPAGAAVGYFSAKLVRRWIPGPEAANPLLVTTPEGLGLAWQLRF